MAREPDERTDPKLSILNFQFSLVLDSQFCRSCGPRRADLSVTNQDKDVDKMQRRNNDMTQIDQKTLNNSHCRSNDRFG